MPHDRVDLMAASSSAGFQAAPAMYDRYVGRYSAQLARGLCDAAAIGPGDQVLDVGCGPGALTAHLATLVGASNVAAVDPSAVFLAACRARVPDADVRHASAESLPFEDRTFDAALAQLAVNFMADPELGVREMRRVTRTGGVVAAAVWDYADAMTLLRAFWDAAVALDPRRAAPLDEGQAFPLCHPDRLRSLWEAVGLEGIRTAALTAAADYESFDDLWAPFLAGVGPAGVYAASLDDRAQAALRAEYHRRLGSPTGAFRLTARAWCVVGGVPRPSGV